MKETKIEYVNEIVNKINSESIESENRIDDVINSIKNYTMQNINMNIGELFLLDDSGKLHYIPVPKNLVHGPLGKMLIKSHITKIDNINTIIECDFVKGKVSKYKKEEKALAESDYKKVQKLIEEKGVAGLEELELEDYFIANIFDKDKAHIKIYDMIFSDDKETGLKPFVISSKPVDEIDQEYDEEKLINYFK